MATDVSVFGKRTTPSLAQRVMDSPSLTATPSPSQPAHVPADGLSKRYAQLYAIASAAMAEEDDVGRRVELDRIVQFADSALAAAAAAASSSGAPVPNITLPAPPQATSMGAAPQAAPAAPNPGAQAAPPPGAVPAA